MRLPRYRPERLKVQSSEEIGKACVPAGKAAAIVEIVGAVPAEDHIAESESFLHGGNEFVPRDDLSPEQTIEVEPAYLNALNLLLIQPVLNRRRIHSLS